MSHPNYSYSDAITSFVPGKDAPKTDRKLDRFSSICQIFVTCACLGDQAQLDFAGKTKEYITVVTDSTLRHA